MLAELSSSLPRGTSARASLSFVCEEKHHARCAPAPKTALHGCPPACILRRPQLCEAPFFTRPRRIELRAVLGPRPTFHVPWIQPFPNAVHADGCSQPRTVFRGVPDASIPLFSFALAHQSLHLLCTPTVFSGATMVLPLDLCCGKIPEGRFGTKCMFQAPSQTRRKSPEFCLSHSRVRFPTEVRLMPNPASMQSAKRLH